jgi:CheY-like chemotaxis protein
MTKTATILVIDDDADIREMMKIVLEADGYQVNVAADGVEALEQLKGGSRPSLIILDLMMPGLDGEQFVKQIRSGVFADVPIVVLSGHSAAERKAEELSAICLMKPVEVDELLKTAERFAVPSKRAPAA